MLAAVSDQGTLVGNTHTHPTDKHLQQQKQQISEMKLKDSLHWLSQSKNQNNTLFLDDCFHLS